MKCAILWTNIFQDASLLITKLFYFGKISFTFENCFLLFAFGVIIYFIYLFKKKERKSYVTLIIEKTNPRIKNEFEG